MFKTNLRYYEGLLLSEVAHVWGSQVVHDPEIVGGEWGHEVSGGQGGVTARKPAASVVGQRGKVTTENTTTLLFYSSRKPKERIVAKKVISQRNQVIHIFNNNNKCM